MRNLAAGTALLLALFYPMTAGAGVSNDIQPGSAPTDSSREYGATASGNRPGTDRTPEGKNILSGCLIATHLDPLQVLDQLTIYESHAAPFATRDPGQAEDFYTFIGCADDLFSGNPWTIWPETDPPPRQVVDAVALAAYNQSVVPLPTPMSSPEGSQQIPYLAQLETWYWTDETLWQAASVTASLPILGISVTATVTPTQSQWDPGDGTPIIICERGTEWTSQEGQVDNPNRLAPCGHTYRQSTQHDGQINPLTLTSSINWEVTYTCVPANNCTGPPNVPGAITTTVSRDIIVTEIRGILTG